MLKVMQADLKNVYRLFEKKMWNANENEILQLTKL